LEEVGAVHGRGANADADLAAEWGRPGYLPKLETFGSTRPANDDGAHASGRDRSPCSFYLGGGIAPASAGWLSFSTHEERSKKRNSSAFSFVT
jgi:hypothetical protein